MKLPPGTLTSIEWDNATQKQKVVYKIGTIPENEPWTDVLGDGYSPEGLWALHFPDFPLPDPSFTERWLNWKPGEVNEALKITARKQNTLSDLYTNPGGPSQRFAMYATGCLKNMSNPTGANYHKVSHKFSYSAKFIDLKKNIERDREKLYEEFKARYTKEEQQRAVAELQLVEATGRKFRTAKQEES